MQLSDLTVEVRDITLKRLGQISHEDLLLNLADVHNGVGTWKVDLPAEHPLAEALRQPGAGIIVTGPGDFVFSGPVTSPKRVASSKDPAGKVAYEGVTDDVVLADLLAWPEPTNPDAEAQANSHDVRSGPAESLLHDYVNANAGPAAPAARRKANLVMGADQGRGASLQKRARFPVLGDLLNEIAGADLGFRVVQRGDELVFETYQVADRTKEIRLDVENGSLSSETIKTSPPGATQIIVAGAGELVDRMFLAATTAEAQAAEQQWGRRIERFVDQRQTELVEELQQAADEVLSEEGFTAIAVEAVPMDVEDGNMRFAHDWAMGDRVSVILNGAESTAIVTGYVLIADARGFRLGATIGDTSDFNPGAALASRVDNTARRVSALERNSGGGGGAPVDHAHDYATSGHSHAQADTGWVELSTQSGWSPYQTGIGQSWTPRCRKLNGVVHVEGLVNGGPTGTAVILPVGYRPGSGTTMRLAITSAGYQRLDLSGNGAMSFQADVANATTTGWHNIACSFVAEN